jgi:hypothetical protein
MMNSPTTLAHQGQESQAGFLCYVLRGGVENRDAAITHSTWQNMRTGPAVLSLALWRGG